MILADILVSALTEFTLRAGVRDAMFYRRNKKQIKKLLSESNFAQKMLHSFSYKKSFAPRHMVFFQTVRIINFLIFSAAMILCLFPNSERIYEHIFYLKIILLYIPYYVYTFIPAVICAKPGEKKINFDIFKKP